MFYKIDLTVMQLVELKEEVLRLIQQKIEEKIRQLQMEIQHLQESILSDTKSSAGDKYETGREMSNIEINKLGNILQQQIEHARQLHHISKLPQNSSVQLGSIVETEMAFYFIGVTSEKIHISGQKPIFPISTGAPIAQALLTKTCGNSILFNNQKLIILNLA